MGVNMLFKLTAIDTDQNWLEFIKSTFVNDNIEILLESQEDEAIYRIPAYKPNVVMLSVKDIGRNVYEFIRTCKSIDPHISIIILAENSTAKDAIDIMKCGVFDYVNKPLNEKDLRDVVEKALNCSIMNCRVKFHGNKNPIVLRSVDEDIMIGSSRAMMDIWKRIGLIAGSESTVLILGESGTGKELLARAIHMNSSRKNRLFLAINCAAIPETLMESELFGHEQGAFTDAQCKRIGKFELCGDGTILLDEIGELSWASQSKLLRVLEQQSFERIGGNKQIKTDVRLIATTSRDLEIAIKEKKFRLDLYYRLNVVAFRLPALRERTEDISLLIKLFINKFCKEHGKPEKLVSPKLMQALKLHPWEGNIRELKNIINRAVVVSKNEFLDVEDFAPLRLKVHSVNKIMVTEKDDWYDNFKKMLEPDFDLICDKYKGMINKKILYEAEKAILHLSLKRYHANESRTAKALGISRTTLRDKMKKYALPD
jgi:DNA-binding NtrC family response regulator